MAFPAFDRDDNPEPVRRESASEKSPSVPGTDDNEPSLLDTVLHRTLEDAKSQAPFGATDVEPFLTVARRYRERRFELEPVAVALVETALQQHFQLDAGLPDDWERMTFSIAETLFDDPTANERLEAFWSSLLAML